MKITTTKKLRGVLELPSVKMQLSYNHQKNKPQIATVNDCNYKNNDIRVAVSMNLITLSEVPTDEQIQEQEESGQMQQMIRLTNKTNTPMLVEVEANEKAKEIPAHGSIYVPMIAVQSAHVRKALENGILESEELGNLFTEAADIEELDIDATTPMIANPNNETMPETEHTIKSNQVKNTATVKPEEKNSKAQVYSPKDIVDKEEEDDTDISFVDKEQEQERISFRRGKTSKKTKKSSKSNDITTTEVVQTEKMDGTTPLVVKRASRKTSKKKENKDMFETSAKDTKNEVEPIIVKSENNNDSVDTSLPSTEETNNSKGSIFNL